MLKLVVGFLLIEALMFLGGVFGFLKKRTKEDTQLILDRFKILWNSHRELTGACLVIAVVLIGALDYFIGSLFLAPFGF